MNINRRTIAASAVVIVMLAQFAFTGCTRTFYRRQADLEAYSLVREKANHPHWGLPDYSISVDPRSRMFDPHAIDCPPLPADDATAHQLMHCVDNKRGWPFWHDNGERPYVENPAWPEYIEVDDKGVLHVSAEDAVRLALLHSRTYQGQLENLYLSALDVSFERFQFDTQAFYGNSIFGEWFGPARGGASTLEVNTDAQLRRTFSTGSQLVVNFANSLLWQFAGPDDYRGTTIIDFNFVQPLLRSAGRDFFLEGLTQSERQLLYDVRLMEQFRQGFYINVMTGQGAGDGPGANQLGPGLPSGSPAGSAGNYLGLLRTQRNIQNQEDNVRRVRRNLARLALQRDVQPQEATSDYLNQSLQVAQARQQLLQSEGDLLDARNGYQATLDNFKVNVLNVPPQICLEPTDDILNQFELIQPDIIRLPEDWEEMLTKHVDARRTIAERILRNIVSEGVPPVCRLPRYAESMDQAGNRVPGLDEDLTALRPALAEMQQFTDTIVNVHLPAIKRDIAVFRAAAPRRKASLERLAARMDELSRSNCELLPLPNNPLEAVVGGSSGEALYQRVEQSLADAEARFQLINEHFQSYATALAERGRLVEELMANKEQTPEQLFEFVVLRVYNPNFECGKTRILTMDVVEDITRELTELQLLQAIARTESVELQEIDIKFDQALEVARKYRRDWMNARAELVDNWRQVQVASDGLQGFLSLVFDGDIRNVGDNPFNLRSTAGRLRAGVEFDAPLTRLSERNNYRRALIQYQQARRNYYGFEDGVAQLLRIHLRNITTNQFQFELQRLAVLQAAEQVMLNAFIDQESQRRLTTRVTAARDVLQALQALLSAQNAYMDIWISYEILRLSLDYNLGTMQLDSEGKWIDPGVIGAEYGQFDPWLWRSNEFHGEVIPGGIETLPPAKAAEPVHQLPPAFLLPSPTATQISEASASRLLPGPPLPGQQPEN
jgi:hypothetical protein